MGWKADYEQERTWEPDQRLELVVGESMRYAAKFKITRKGLNYIAFIAAVTDRKALSPIRRLLNPRLQEHLTWHVDWCAGDLPEKAMRRTITDALRAYQQRHGVANFRSGEKVYGRVTVKFGSHPSMEP